LFEIFEGLVTKLGLSYVPVNLPPARLVKSVAEGDVDISLLPISFPELAGRVLASKLPVEHIILEAYTIYPSLPVTKIQDLIGKSVILQQGFGYGGLVNFLRAPENKINIVGTVPSAENGMRMLTAERGDVLLHYRPAIEKLRTQMDLSGLTANVLSAVPVHVVLSKSVPNSEALMARIDAIVIPSLLRP
jgi:polar amino acid transport system substrate-binding protein